MMIYGVSYPAAPAAILYSIKRSHRYYPRAWQKHIGDYHLLKKYCGGVDDIDKITAIRERETEARYGPLKTPSLQKTVDTFFNDNVSNKVFIHDDIHAAVAYRDKPMFEYIKADPTLVKCSMEKFYALSMEDRMRCVLEEAYVIALERGIIPMLYQQGPPTYSRGCPTVGFNAHLYHSYLGLVP